MEGAKCPAACLSASSSCHDEGASNFNIKVKQAGEMERIVKLGKEGSEGWEGPPGELSVKHFEISDMCRAVAASEFR